MQAKTTISLPGAINSITESDQLKVNGTTLSHNAVTSQKPGAI